MLDQDLRRFEEGLGQTRAGLRLRLAMHESRIAVQQIQIAQKLGGPQSARAVASWRRAHIKACNNAAEAIDALWTDHHWPADGARARDYEWRPNPNFER